MATARRLVGFKQGVLRSWTCSRTFCLQERYFSTAERLPVHEASENPEKGAVSSSQPEGPPMIRPQSVPRAYQFGNNYNNPWSRPQLTAEQLDDPKPMRPHQVSLLIQPMVKSGQLWAIERILQNWLNDENGALSRAHVTQFMAAASWARNWGLVKECWKWLLIDAKIIPLKDETENPSFEHTILQSLPDPPQGVLQSQSMAVYCDAIAMHGTIKDLEEAWAYIQSIPRSQKIMMMNNYTAYMEALFRLGQTEAAINFFLGPPDTKGQDVVSRFKTQLDPKSVGVFMKHYRSVTPDPGVAIKKMETVWPLFNIRALVRRR